MAYFNPTKPTQILEEVQRASTGYGHEVGQFLNWLENKNKEHNTLGTTSRMHAPTFLASSVMVLSAVGVAAATPFIGAVAPAAAVGLALGSLATMVGSSIVASIKSSNAHQRFEQVRECIKYFGFDEHTSMNKLSENQKEVLVGLSHQNLSSLHMFIEDEKDALNDSYKDKGFKNKIASIRESAFGTKPEQDITIRSKNNK